MRLTRVEPDKSFRGMTYRNDEAVGVMDGGLETLKVKYKKEPRVGF